MSVLLQTLAGVLPRLYYHFLRKAFAIGFATLRIHLLRSDEEVEEFHLVELHQDQHGVIVFMRVKISVEDLRGLGEGVHMLAQRICK